MKLAMIDDYLPALVEGEAVFLIAELPAGGHGAAGFAAFARDSRRMGDIQTEVGGGQGCTAHARLCSAAGAHTAACQAAVRKMSFREGLSDVTIKPSFFLKSSTSVIGPNDIVELPPVDAWVFHHEAELAVIIGKRAKAVAPEKAMEHVFGYTCFMDISARGIGAGTSYEDKSYDTFGPMGPWILTADEIPDPHSLQVKLWVNGNLRHDYPMRILAIPLLR